MNVGATLETATPNGDPGGSLLLPVVEGFREDKATGLSVPIHKAVEVAKIALPTGELYRLEPNPGYERSYTSDLVVPPYAIDYGREGRLQRFKQRWLEYQETTQRNRAILDANHRLVKGFHRLVVGLTVTAGVSFGSSFVEGPQQNILQEGRPLSVTLAVVYGGLSILTRKVTKLHTIHEIPNGSNS